MTLKYKNSNLFKTKQTLPVEEPILSRKNTRPFLRQEIEPTLPNINNQEQSWMTVTGTENLDGKTNVVDNNDFYTHNAMRNINDKYNEQQKQDDLHSQIASLEEDEYLLFVSDVPVCSGNMEDIQEEARKFVFGEHRLSYNDPVDPKDIFVIKKVAMKIGLFLGA